MIQRARAREREKHGAVFKQESRGLTCSSVSKSNSSFMNTCISLASAIIHSHRTVVMAMTPRLIEDTLFKCEFLQELDHLHLARHLLRLVKYRQRQMSTTHISFSFFFFRLFPDRDSKQHLFRRRGLLGRGVLGRRRDRLLWYGVGRERRGRHARHRGTRLQTALNAVLVMHESNLHKL